MASKYMYLLWLTKFDPGTSIARDQGVVLALVQTVKA